MTCQINTYLVKAMKYKYKNLNQTNTQLASKGATNFKRKIMGVCGTKAIKSVDELVEILLSLNLNNANEKSRNELILMTSELDNQKLQYDWGELYFKKIEQNSKDNAPVKYLITKC